VLKKNKRVHGGDKDQKQEETEKYKKMEKRGNKPVWSGYCVLGSALSTNPGLSAHVC